MEKYVLGSEENKLFLKEQLDNLLNFGKNFAAPGGGSFYLGMDGTPIESKGIETWITCRMAHVYSISTLLGNEEDKNLAKQALLGLQKFLHDEENGGWYAGRYLDGTVMPTKQCYAHAFVILAATSLILAGVEGAKELLKEALEIYDKYFWNDKEQMSCDTWNTEFKQLDPYRGINANMHTVEAFLAVADACGYEDYRKRAGNIIDRVVAWAKDNNWRIPEHFNDEWEVDLDKNKDKPDDPFKPYGATCGHGIEWARLIIQWTCSTYGKDSDDAISYIDAAKKLYERAHMDSWNADGEKGIVYTTDWDGKPVVRDRMHWTLAEAINTSAVLYNITGEAQYASDYQEYMQYLDETVIDHVNGSWYHQLDENNKLKETVWPGKSDLYHAVQSMLIPYLDVEKSIAFAISEM